MRRRFQPVNPVGLMRILFDQGVPRGLTASLQGYEVDAHSPMTGQRRLQRKAFSICEQRPAAEYSFTCGAHCGAGWLSGVKAPRNRIRVDQVGVAFKPNGRRRRGLSDPFGPAIIVSVGILPDGCCDLA